MKRIVSGLTATGDLTLGNYLGSIKNLVEAQDQFDVYMFVADLHAITLPIDANELRENVKRQIKTYLACGIDVNKTKLFKQSEIKGHTDLFYYLTTISNEGQLKRMTQYKDKSIKNQNKTETIPLGLLMYPILMAADIILYNAEGVIVGKDQKQHVELTRDLVDRLNSKFNLNINSPEPIIKKDGAKIMALRTPTKKMSKSDKDVNETIFLLDDPEIARKKIMSSLTDSENKVYFNEKDKPGVSNLLTIYSIISGNSIDELETHFKNYNYKEFKEEVADSVVNLLKTIQNKYNSIDDDNIKDALSKNIKEVQLKADDILNKIEFAFGTK